MAKVMKVRFRVDFSRACSVGIGKIELLEGIARTGSLSQAAREMGMSYRRAWLLLEDLNASFDRPVARASAGGRGGGGAMLTAFGDRLVTGYRKLDAGLQTLAGGLLDDFGEHIRGARSERVVPTASIRARLPVRAKRTAAIRRR